MTRTAGPDTVAPSLAKTLLELADHEPADVTLIRLAARREAARRSKGPEPAPLTISAPERERLAMLDLLGELRDRRIRASCF